MTEVHSSGLYCTGNGREIKKNINFKPTVFSPGGSSEAKCRRKRATISPQSPSSVVPGNCVTDVIYNLFITYFLMPIILKYIDI